MACEASNTFHTPYADSALDDPWTKADSSDNGNNLDAISEFNAAFDANGIGSTLEPRFTFCSTPDLNGQHDVGQPGFSPGTADHTVYSADFGPGVPSPPFLHSVENSSAPSFHPSPLRMNYRRSVSEPPGAPLMHHQPPPTMTFHRENHFLGKPMQQQAMPLKSLPKSKQARHHPYPRKTERHHQQQYFRPEHRRAQTQPVHTGPTSAPFHPGTPVYFPQPAQIEQRYLSSRVCTPVPGDTLGSPLPIDPALSAMPTQQIHVLQPMRSDPRGTLSIPMTIDELRTMIFEAVQKAMGVGNSRGGDVAANAESVVVGEEATEAVVSAVANSPAEGVITGQ